jgi:hypothetical protein
LSAGHSKKPLAQKLGIAQGKRVAFLHAPGGYRASLGTLPRAVTVARGPDDGLDLIQIFAKDRATLEREFPPLKRSIKRDGMIWVSWPKHSSGLQTDLDEGAVRLLGLQNGMVDVKTCAIDDTWSGLKFVVRLKDRD